MLDGSYLKVSSNIKCYGSGWMNHIKNGEVKTECQNSGAENNDECWPRIWMST